MLQKSNIKNLGERDLMKLIELHRVAKEEGPQAEDLDLAVTARMETPEDHLAVFINSLGDSNLEAISLKMIIQDRDNFSATRIEVLLNKLEILKDVFQFIHK